MKTRRRFWLPLFLGLIVGSGVWWGVGEWLSPRPTWKMTLKPNERMIHGSRVFFRTSVFEGNRTTDRRYDIATGQLRCEYQSKPNALHADTKAALQQLPAEPQRYQIELLEPHPGYYMRDMETGRLYEFHGQATEDIYDKLFFQSFKPKTHEVLTRSLPLFLPAVLTPSVNVSPAYAFAQATITNHPSFSPTSVKIITVPGMQIVQRLLLEPGWTYFRPVVNDSGSCLSLIRYRPDQIKAKQLMFVPLKSDSSATRYVDLGTDPVPYMYYVNDEHLYLMQMDTNQRKESVSLWNTVTGVVLRHVENFSTPYLFSQNDDLSRLCHVVRPEQGSMVLYRIGSDGRAIEVARRPGSVENKTERLGAGLQGFYFSPLFERLREWLTKVMPAAWSEWIVSKLRRSTLVVYDWNTGLTESLGSASDAFLIHDKYLVVIQFSDGGEQVRVYTFPLTLHSPWWGRSAGLVVAVLVWVLLLRTTRTRENTS